MDKLLKPSHVMLAVSFSQPFKKDNVVVACIDLTALFSQNSITSTLTFPINSMKVKTRGVEVSAKMKQSLETVSTSCSVCLRATPPITLGDREAQGLMGFPQRPNLH